MILTDSFVLRQLNLPAQRAYEEGVLEAVENPLAVYSLDDLVDGQWTVPVMELLIHSYWLEKARGKTREQYLRGHFLRGQEQCLDSASNFLSIATLRSPPLTVYLEAAISVLLGMFLAVLQLYNAVLLHRLQMVSGKFSISAAHFWIQTLLY